MRKKILSIIFIVSMLISKLIFAQAGFYGTISANNSRGSTSAITVGATPNTCANIGNLKTGIVQVRNLSASTMDNYIASEGCFVNTHSGTSTYKNMWFRVVIPSGSTVQGLYFYSVIAGTQPTSSTNIRTAYINVFQSNLTTCQPALVCSQKMDNIIMSYNCCSSPYLDPYGTRRVDVSANSTYYVEVWTLSTSTDPNYNFDINVVPVGAHQSNETCSNASAYTTTSTNCNLGAYPSCNTYEPPCWGTVDNSVFFKFNRPSGSAFTVTVDNIVCEGGGGSLQGAIFRANTTNCTTNLTSGNTNTGTSSSTNPLCEWTTGTLTFNVSDALAAGTEYILWLDGDAGAACSWGITVLDVDLLYFKTNCRNGSAILEWSSAKEENNSRYIIEKSINGLDFKEIGTVKGHEKSYELKHYEFIDTEPYDGVSYYRLKQLDYDDSEELLGLVSFEPTCSKKDVSLYPNPAKNYVSIEYDSFLNSSIDIEIINPVGQIIKKTTHASTSENKYETAIIDINELPTGVYMVMVSGKYSSKKIKFIKE